MKENKKVSWPSWKQTLGTSDFWSGLDTRCILSWCSAFQPSCDRWHQQGCSVVGWWMSRGDKWQSRADFWQFSINRKFDPPIFVLKNNSHFQHYLSTSHRVFTGIPSGHVRRHRPVSYSPAPPTAKLLGMRRLHSIFLKWLSFGSFVSPQCSVETVFTKDQWQMTIRWESRSQF